MLNVYNGLAPCTIQPQLISNLIKALLSFIHSAEGSTDKKRDAASTSCRPCGTSKEAPLASAQPVSHCIVPFCPMCEECSPSKAGKERLRTALHHDNYITKPLSACAGVYSVTAIVVSLNLCSPLLVVGNTVTCIMQCLCGVTSMRTMNV